MTHYHDLETPFGQLYIVSDGATARVTSYAEQERHATINGVEYDIWANLERGPNDWRIAGDTPYLQWQNVSGARADWLTTSRRYEDCKLTRAAYSKLLAALPAAVKAWTSANPRAQAEEAVRRAEADHERAARKVAEAEAAASSARAVLASASEALGAARDRLAAVEAQA